MPLPGPQRAQQQQMLGLAAVATDWETQQALPVPLLARCAVRQGGGAARAAKPPWLRPVEPFPASCAPTLSWRARRPAPSLHTAPLPPRCSLTPHGDVTISLLQGHQPGGQQAQRAQHTQRDQSPAAPLEPQQQAAPTPPALPLLLPATEAAGGGGSDQEDMGPAADGAAVAAPGAPLLPYVRGVPRALVAAVAAGELGWVLRSYFAPNPPSSLVSSLRRLK